VYLVQNKNATSNVVLLCNAMHECVINILSPKLGKVPSECFPIMQQRLDARI